jgi:hypothetical protein
MKIRSGFVSNSSSSSYIVQKKNLSEEQIDMIKNHIDVCLKLIEEDKLKNKRNVSDKDPYGEENWDGNDLIVGLKSMMMYGERYSVDQNDMWSIIDGDKNLFLYTIMANFDMEWFLLNVVGVDEKDIEWKDY